MEFLYRENLHLDTWSSIDFLYRENLHLDTWSSMSSRIWNIPRDNGETKLWTFSIRLYYSKKRFV